MLLRVIVDRRHRNSKVAYYVSSTVAALLPRQLHVRRIAGVAARVGPPDDEVLTRLDYYNQVTAPTMIRDAVSIAEFRRTKRSVYYLDLLPHLRCFEDTRRFKYVFGDVTHVPPEPAFVKSRPIGGDNRNSVLMKLDSPRHFCFVSDAIPFASKRPRLVWRGRLHLKSKKERRLDFLQQYHAAPFCDVGHVNRENVYTDYRRPPLSVGDQLAFKYVLSLEGNDVATNLKWIMSSNSLCLAPRPRFETWFMEGRLIPDHHYVEIADDFRDIEEKIGHYERHPDEAQAIIANANAYVRQFLDADREALLGHLVVCRYFEQCVVEPSSVGQLRAAA
jgi:hypothetical protein